MLVFFAYNTQCFYLFSHFSLKIINETYTKINRCIVFYIVVMKGADAIYLMHVYVVYFGFIKSRLHVSVCIQLIRRPERY